MSNKNKSHYNPNAALAELENVIGKEKFVEVVDCAALNIREYPDGPVVSVASCGTRLKVSNKESETAGWTCVVSPVDHKDAYAMTHFLKEV